MTWSLWCKDGETWTLISAGHPDMQAGQKARTDYKMGTLRLTGFVPATKLQNDGASYERLKGGE